MVITILEAHVDAGKSTTLLEAYRRDLSNLPPQMVRTYITQSLSD